MTAKALLVCRGLHAAHWQLGPPRTNMLLIGWAGFPSIDAGLPEPIAMLLADALASTGHVSYLAAVKRRITGGSFDRLRRSSRLELVTSIAARPIAAAFDDADAPWWLQGQVLLGTLPGRPPPEVTSADLTALLSDHWCEVAMRLTSVTWALRPGVDGDVAGLCPRDAEISQAVFDALERSVTAAGLKFDLLDETLFTDRLSH